MDVSFQLHVPAALSPGKKALSTHWIGGGEGLRTGVDAVGKIKISHPCSSSPQPSHYADRATSSQLTG